MNAVATSEPSTFPVWKRIQLGVHKNAESYRQALRDADIWVSWDADRLLDQMAFTQKETEQDLVSVQVSDLRINGYVNAFTVRAIAQRRFGLKLCSPEIAPALRLLHLDQPVNERMLFGMTAIGRDLSNPDDRFGKLFEIGHNRQQLVFNTVEDSFGGLWGSENCRFIFVRPAE